MHGKGLTSLHHNQYTGNLFIQASEHPPSCWTRFGENCKTTKPSPGLSMLLKKTGNGCADKHSTHVISAWTRSTKSETQSIHRDPVHLIYRTPTLWEQIWWELLQNYDAILRLLYVLTWRTKVHGWLTTHSMCLVDAWSGLRSPKLWDRTWWKLQNHPTVLRRWKMLLSEELHFMDVLASIAHVL